MKTQEIKQLIKESLKLEIEREYEDDYQWLHIKLVFDGEIISSETVRVKL